MSTSLAACLPDSWRPLLSDELPQPYSARLDAFVAAERAAHTFFPPEEDVFNALKLVAPDELRVLLLGQDPYHDDGQYRSPPKATRSSRLTTPSPLRSRS